MDRMPKQRRNCGSQNFSVFWPYKYHRMRSRTSIVDKEISWNQITQRYRWRLIADGRSKDFCIYFLFREAIVSSVCWKVKIAPSVAASVSAVQPDSQQWAELHVVHWWLIVTLPLRSHGNESETEAATFVLIDVLSEAKICLATVHTNESGFTLTSSRNLFFVFMNSLIEVIGTDIVLLFRLRTTRKIVCTIQGLFLRNDGIFGYRFRILYVFARSLIYHQKRNITITML